MKLTLIILLSVSLLAVGSPVEKERLQLEGQRKAQAEQQLRQDALMRLLPSHILEVARRQQDRLQKRLDEYVELVKHMGKRKHLDTITSGAILSEHYRMTVDTQARLRDREQNPEKLRDMRLRYQLVNEIITLEAVDFMIAYGRRMLEESRSSSKASRQDRKLAAMRRALADLSHHAKRDSVFHQSENLLINASDNGNTLQKRFHYFYTAADDLAVQEALRLAEQFAHMTFNNNQPSIPAWRRALALIKK